MCVLTRRDPESVKNGLRRRFETALFPGGSVKYTFYADSYRGDWQEGLRLMFQDRLLYDVEPGTFNNSLFEREDLAWIRHSFLNQAMMAWDHNFYDADKGFFPIPQSQIDLSEGLLEQNEEYSQSGLGLYRGWQN